MASSTWVPSEPLCSAHGTALPQLQLPITQVKKKKKKAFLLLAFNFLPFNFVDWLSFLAEGEGSL